jgi:hypothetical protein
MNDLPSSPRRPLLTLPWEAGVTGWIVVFGAVVAELVAGIVTNRMPMATAVPAIAFPVVAAAGFAVVQWQQVRSSGAEPASWWHLAAIPLAAFTWLVWPTAPGVLAPAGSARAACIILVGQPTPECLSRAAHAMAGRSLVWWLTGGLIVAAALGARRSRIAAWAAIPAALGGCILATHFLELLIVQYNAGG